MPKVAIIVGVASFLLAFIASVVLTPLVRRWALQRSFVDSPVGAGSHKTHKKPIPFGGGIAITVSTLMPIAILLLIAFLLSRADPNQFAWLSHIVPNWRDWLQGVVSKTPPALAVIAGALSMHLLGIIDDQRPLSPMLKLAIQVIVALMLTAGFGIRAATVLGPIPSVILTTLWIVALTNAFNFIDNMDGLSAGVALITSIILAISSFVAGQVFVPCTLLILAGAVLGFLIYNFPPASIFMGDAGSLVVGYLLAVCTVLITYYDPEQQRKPFGVFVPLLIFAVPLYDMISVIVVRLRAGSSVFRSDRRHFSHRLMRLGMGSTSAVLTIYLATTATALPALLLPMVNWFGAGVIFGQCLCVVAIIAILESRNG